MRHDRYTEPAEVRVTSRVIGMLMAVDEIANRCATELFSNRDDLLGGTCALAVDEQRSFRADQEASVCAAAASEDVNLGGDLRRAHRWRCSILSGLSSSCSDQHRDDDCNNRRTTTAFCLEAHERSPGLLRGRVWNWVKEVATELSFTGDDELNCLVCRRSGVPPGSPA